MRDIRSKLHVVVALLAVVVIVGCGDDDENGDSNGATGTIGTAAPITTSTSTVGGITVEQIRDLIDSTPEAIARDVNTLGLTRAPVTTAGVADVARRLCESEFAPSVATAWLQVSGVTRSYLLVGPADRLLALAGQRQTCTRPPTTAEASTYRTGVYEYLVPTGTGIAGQPRPVAVNTQPVCNFLGQRAVGDAASAVLDSVLKAVSGDRIEAGQILAFLVEVAGSTCDRWLPTAVEAFDRFLETS